MEVVDDSMTPTLLPGDRLYVNRGEYRDRPPQPGEVVVLRDPEDPKRWLIKRVHAIRESSGTLWVDVRGDNVERSRDSRHFGWVPLSQVSGLVWYRYRPPSREGPLR